MINSNYRLILNHKGTIGHQNYLDLDLTFQIYPRSKVTKPKESPYICELLFMFNSKYRSILNCKGAIDHFNYPDLDLTFQGHPRSKVMVPNERSYMTSYMLSMITLPLE